MDAKTIMAGAVLAISGAIAGATTVFMSRNAVQDATQPTISAPQVCQGTLCTKQREGTSNGVIMTWVCAGSRVPDETQALINEEAGDALDWCYNGPIK